MQIEYEATYWPINKDEVRSRLQKAGAICSYPERLMRRVVFHLHPDAPLKNAWARVRDEGDRITLSLKQSGSELEEQKELQMDVSDFESAVEILKNVGCIERAYQETRRELWRLNDVDITIDEWPFLEPCVEIEGSSEASIKEVSEKLGFSWDAALFCSADVLYTKRYAITLDDINKRTPRLCFEDTNPFDGLIGSQ
jgi:adenylate cyclase class 2